MNNTTWVTSDLHIGHANILKYNPATRQYNDVDHMNASMIAEWNTTIGPKDLVYILGDVAFCHADKAFEIYRQLNGRKILVKGNHDAKLIKDGKFATLFESVHDYLEISFNGTHVVMFHYPIVGHNRCHYGSVMLHGHRHGNPSGVGGRIMDVGVDATGKIAVKMADVIAKLVMENPKQHHPERV